MNRRMSNDSPFAVPTMVNIHLSMPFCHQKSLFPNCCQTNEKKVLVQLRMKKFFQQEKLSQLILKTNHLATEWTARLFEYKIFFSYFLTEIFLKQFRTVLYKYNNGTQIMMIISCRFFPYFFLLLISTTPVPLVATTHPPVVCFHCFNVCFSFFARYFGFCAFSYSCQPIRSSWLLHCNPI